MSNPHACRILIQGFRDLQVLVFVQVNRQLNGVMHIKYMPRFGKRGLYIIQQSNKVPTGFEFLELNAQT
jgi:hypothetical protein